MSRLKVILIVYIGQCSSTNCYLAALADIYNPNIKKIQKTRKCILSFIVKKGMQESTAFLIFDRNV